MKDLLASLLLRYSGEGCVVLDADCTTSTGTSFVEAHNPSSFINMGICEQNMIGVAAGLAATGLIPIVNGFAAMVLFRAAEQLVHSVSYPSANVKILGHYSGFSSEIEGAAHHCLNDIALICSLPNFSVHTPVDCESLELALQLAISEPGPAYVRLYRGNAIAHLPPDTVRLGPALIFGARKARNVIVAFGNIIDEVIELRSRLLEPHGFLVICVLRLKPFPSRILGDLLDTAKLVIVVEEHCGHGGLYAMVSALLLEKHLNVEKIIGLNAGDRHYSSASLGELRAQAGISAESIFGKIDRLLRDHA